MRNLTFLSLVFALSGTVLAAQERPNVFNPKITLFGNFFGRLDDRAVMNDDGDLIDDRFNLRETELSFSAAVDPFTDAKITLTAESELPGEFEVGIEEGYVIFKRVPGFEQMPWGLRFDVGRFRPSFGRYNQLHTHDLPHVTRPLSLQTFLGPEGYVQNGINAQMNLPSPGENFALGLDIALLNGGDIAVASGNEGEDAAGLGRLNAFYEWGEGHSVEVGGSVFHGRRDLMGTTDADLYGVDFAYLWQPFTASEVSSVVLGGEAYYADLENAGVTSSSPWGGFLYGQYQLDQSWYLGGRYDYVEDLADDTMETRSVSAFATFYTSEFNRVRLGWEHFNSDDSSLDGLDTLFIEFTFAIGAHPPHPYLVNR